MSEDENGLNQVFTFGIVTSREKAKFVEYLTELKRRIGNIRLFVCDRHRTQVAAIKEVFPDSHIIFCRVHIGRNIRDKVGVEMARLFKDVFSGEITESDFLDVCEQHIANNNGAKSAKFLETLLTEKEHWLPSLTATSSCER